MQAWTEWDIPSFIAQAAHWQKAPPVHKLVAWYLDFNPPSDADPSSKSEDDQFNELIGAIGGN